MNSMIWRITSAGKAKRQYSIYQRPDKTFFVHSGHMGKADGAVIADNLTRKEAEDFVNVYGKHAAKTENWLDRLKE